MAQCSGMLADTGVGAGFGMGDGGHEGGGDGGHEVGHGGGHEVDVGVDIDVEVGHDCRGAEKICMICGVRVGRSRA